MRNSSIRFFASRSVWAVFAALLMLAMACSSALAEGGVKVVYPNGGETWHQGTTYPINWTADMSVAYVRVELYRNGEPVSLVGTEIYAHSDSTTMSVGTVLEPGDGYKIKVTDMTLPSKRYDISDETFTVGEPAGFAVSAPIGGETWIVGETRGITWSSYGEPGDTCDISLWKNGERVRYLAQGTENDGSFSWTLTDDLASGTDYTVLIQSVDDPYLANASEAAFTIQAAETIELVSPNGYEVWQNATTYAVNWEATGTTTSARIDLFKGGSFLKNIVTGDTTGAYLWSVDVDDAYATDYTVQVTSDELSSLHDESDAQFTIVSTALDYGYTVTAPNGGETLEWDSVATITWGSVAADDLVDISLYKDGEYLATLAESAPNTGSFNWFVTGEVGSGGDYAVRVAGASDESTYDMSDGWFTIANARRGTKAIAPATTLLLSE